MNNSIRCVNNGCISQNIIFCRNNLSHTNSDMPSSNNCLFSEYFLYPNTIYSVTFDFRNLATDPNLTRSMHDKNVVNNLYN